MRKHGLLFILLGFLLLIGFWSYYSNNSIQLLSGMKLVVYLVFITGMVITLFSSLLIGIGIRILIRPMFYTQLVSFIKGNQID